MDGAGTRGRPVRRRVRGRRHRHAPGFRRVSQGVQARTRAVRSHFAGVRSPGSGVRVKPTLTELKPWLRVYAPWVSAAGVEPALAELEPRLRACAQRVSIVQVEPSSRSSNHSCASTTCGCPCSGDRCHPHTAARPRSAPGSRSGRAAQAPSPGSRVLVDVSAG
ncbi:hypothetical protein DFJ67_6955 [Asanoa ferruginea]|uniref:Uncharacterized protein n=1 Tax=Asanoa ferruginea TaxID=53367 RepID=A0A3D9ZUM4_9ACTN|nr:hypothetical protein DFJ67_6955 [Asanoa ferruginea]